MQNFIEFELINNWDMLSFVANNHPYPTSDVTICAESAIYILHIFANSLRIRYEKRLCITVNDQWLYFFMLFKIQQ